MANVAELILQIKGKDDLSKSMRSASGEVDEFAKAARNAEGASKDLDTTWDRLQRGVDEMGNKLDEVSQKIKRDDGVQVAADGFGDLERVLIGLNDNLGVLEEKVGLPVGPMREWVQAGADVAGGLEGIIAGGAGLIRQFGPMVAGLGPVIGATWAHVAALTAQAAAFIVANAPLILIIAGIALLAAGVVLLVKHWDTIEPHLRPPIDYIRDVAIGIFDKLKGAMGTVLEFVRDNWPIIASLIFLPFAPLILLASDAFGIRSAMIDAFTSILDTVTEKVGAFVKLIKGIPAALGNVKDLLFQKGKDLIQGFVDGMKSIPVPNPLDMVPGGGLVKKGGGLLNKAIPGRAAGGPVTAGKPYIVGEKGPEWFVPGQSGNIIPNGASGAPSISFNGPITVVNNGATKDARGTMKDVAFSIAAEMRSRGMWVPA